MRYFFLLLISVFHLVNSTSDYDGVVTIKLEHGLDGTADSKFTERGIINFPSLRIGSNIIHQKLSNEDKEKIISLSRKNQYYQLKATVIINGEETSFKSLIKACMLAEAELTDIITITLDYNSKIITIIESIASTSSCQGADVSPTKLKEFSTSVHVQLTESGPTPDTASYIQKLEREREAKERGEHKDNRSFLAKYWMYIVPVFIIMVLSSSANPEAGQSGGR